MCSSENMHRVILKQKKKKKLVGWTGVKIGKMTEVAVKIQSAY